jgi:PAP2 superfamily
MTFLSRPHTLQYKVNDWRAPSSRALAGPAACALAAGLALAPQPAHAGGPFGIDSELSYDQSGIWQRKYSLALKYGAVAIEGAGALWLGDDSKLGNTFWQTIDASVISGAGAEVLKLGFSRSRPDQGNNPNKWFQGSCCDSFPSGEVTLQASFVTPFIVNYQKEYPWIWALEILPVYDAMARMKAQAHWQSDVLAGFALGSAVGYWSTTRKVPLSVEILPRGITIGLSKRF